MAASATAASERRVPMQRRVILMGAAGARPTRPPRGLPPRPAATQQSLQESRAPHTSHPFPHPCALPECISCFHSCSRCAASLPLLYVCAHIYMYAVARYVALCSERRRTTEHLTTQHTVWHTASPPFLGAVIRAPAAITALRRACAVFTQGAAQGAAGWSSACTWAADRPSMQPVRHLLRPQPLRHPLGRQPLRHLLRCHIQHNAHSLAHARPLLGGCQLCEARSGGRGG